MALTRMAEHVRLSRTTILAPIPGRPEVLVVQPLTGQAALVGADAAAALSSLGNGGPVPALLSEADLRAAGFIVDTDDDERTLFDAAWAEYRAEADRTPTQLVVVPSFGCNLSCTYCYQEPVAPAARGLISAEAIEAFFAYVDRFHASDAARPYVTLFGGEPLVDTPAHRDRLLRLIEGARARRLEVAAVTNGYDLEAFVPMLAEGAVREVQVTLDGPQQVHDRRRRHATGAGTFERVVRGVDRLVAAGVPVNLRVVVDRENVGALPELAKLAEARGWLDLPEMRFKTQIGRNYELFGCASRQRGEQLFDRLELWAAFVAQADAHPALRRFHKPRFHGLRHLADTGELPAPNFDACPAAKKEWAFAPDGTLYGCTASVGNPRYALGRYFPRLERDEVAIARWAGRNVLAMAACRECSVAAVCGGGCGVIAAERAGDPLSPDCRPVCDLYGLGAGYYRLGAGS